MTSAREQFKLRASLFSSLIAHYVVHTYYLVYSTCFIRKEDLFIFHGFVCWWRCKFCSTASSHCSNSQLSSVITDSLCWSELL